MVHERNSLNDLTGREWLFRSKSVINKNFGRGSYAHALRRRFNKTCKPPMLCKNIVEVFTKKNQLVLDPFAGTGGVIIGAQLAERKAIGAELDSEQVAAYQDACCEIGNLFNTFDVYAIKNMNFFDMDVEDNSIDFVFTDPPYFDMDSRQKSKRIWTGEGSKERPMEPFKHEDAQYNSIEDWLLFMEEFGEKTFKAAKDKSYLAYFMEDMYIEKEYIFTTHLSAEAVKKSGWSLQGEFIWYNEARRPGIFGYPTTLITNRTHTSILFFKK